MHVRLRQRHKSEHLTDSSEMGGGLSDLGKIPLPTKTKKGTGIKRRKSIRPMAGRKNKEGREKAIIDHREASLTSVITK